LRAAVLGEFLLNSSSNCVRASRVLKVGGPDSVRRVR
jgi:hypothetical protein